MSSDLDVFVGNTTLIDEEVYRLWLDGHSVAEAVARRLRGGLLEREATSVAVLQSDTRDHYRTFQMLERLLHAPPRLLQQLLFQIPPERQALLVQRYYAFDEALARELLGKKLSKGTKKELDEPLRDGQEAPAVPELRGLRCLRPEHDGPLEPGGPGARGGRARRGPAQVLPAGPEGAEGAGDRQGPAGPAQEPGVLGPAGEDLGLQRARGQLQGAVAGAGERGREADARPRRPRLLRGPGGEGEGHSRAGEPPPRFGDPPPKIRAGFFGGSPPDPPLGGIPEPGGAPPGLGVPNAPVAQALSRALVNVGGKLTHARDVRDFFVDLVEKVIEPCRSDKWSPGDLRLFLQHYTAAPRNLPGFRHQALWERYMAAISACLLRMFHD
ncbi:acidic fibroblast growth factor intracellular-binding protein isoform X3 [Passer montanus]|uniref:acidic fibroblast growth factor intracellular-binding protein isoform X3 n=1 Tax=Passer montanus TaxID=9160 RepID=UPI0019607F7E|nr:acidic fibroblast growth factor intracellular-binding protein isoform X3 [Passer montanus]